MIGRRKENVAEYSAEMRTFNKRKVDSQITGPRFLRFPDKKIKRAFLEKLVYCRTGISDQIRCPYGGPMGNDNMENFQNANSLSPIEIWTEPKKTKDRKVSKVKTIAHVRDSLDLRCPVGICPMIASMPVGFNFRCRQYLP
jgi:hypothetical protein